MDGDEINDVSWKIIGSAIEVHKHLGPGLMESIYEECLVFVMESNGLDVKRQVRLPLNYKGNVLSKHFYLDLLIEDKIVLELKSVERVLPVHEAQLVSYLKLSGKQLGLLINFNVPQLTMGITRKVNKL